MNSDVDDRNAALAPAIMDGFAFMGRRDKPGEDEREVGGFATYDASSFSRIGISRRTTAKTWRRTHGGSRPLDERGADIYDGQLTIKLADMKRGRAGPGRTAGGEPGEPKNGRQKTVRGGAWSPAIVRHSAGGPRMSAPLNPNKALWEKGDFTRIAQSMRANGEALVATLGIVPGLKVLDLGCGDGTTALPEATLGADVLGVDIASNLVAAGNRRAADAGLPNCRFQEGDASNLAGLEDDQFDLVVSIFGAMFAPRPFDVAKEMVRVTRPGGRIVMGNWIPNDPTLVAQILKISSAYSPPPPEGFVSPMAWGVESSVAERFAAAGIARENLSFARDAWVFETAESPSSLLNTFKTFYGPTMNAFDAAASSGRLDELQRELEALFASQNRSADPNKTSISATYLRVTVAVEKS